MDKEEKKNLAILSDIKTTFSSPEGKRVLRYLMQRTGFLSTSYVANDPLTSAFNEGQRAMVVEIVKKLKIDIKKLEYELTRDEGGDDDYIL